MTILTSRTLPHLAHAEKLDVRHLVRQEEGERGTRTAHARGAADAVHERVRRLRWVQLKHPVHVRNIQPPCSDVCAKQTACEAHTRFGIFP